MFTPYMRAGIILSKVLFGEQFEIDTPGKSPSD
jgi:hypothetical protein